MWSIPIVVIAAIFIVARNYLNRFLFEEYQKSLNSKIVDLCHPRLLSELSFHHCCFQYAVNSSISNPIVKLIEFWKVTLKLVEFWKVTLKLVEVIRGHSRSNLLVYIIIHFQNFYFILQAFYRILKRLNWYRIRSWDFSERSIL